MTLRRLLLALTLSLVPLVACRQPVPDEPAPPRVVHAGTISHDCAPWDGAAYRIVLAAATSCASVPPERIELAVWRGFPIETGSRVVIAAGRDDGAILACGPAGSCLQATDGVIEFDRFEEGARAEGTYDATLSDGRTIGGRFSVTWCAGTPLCG